MLSIPSKDGRGILRFLRTNQLIEKIGLSRSSIWRLESQGKFPKRRQIGPGAVGWLEEEVEKWMLERPVAENRASVLKEVA